MINDNFDFKKLLRESIQEREGLRNEASWTPPVRGVTGGSEKMVFDRTPEAKELDMEIPGFKEISPYDADGKEDKFYAKALEIYTDTKNNPATKANAVKILKKHIAARLKSDEEKMSGDEIRRRKKEREGRGEKAKESGAPSPEDKEVHAALKDILDVGWDEWEKARKKIKSPRLAKAMDYIEDVATMSVTAEGLIHEQRYLKLLRKFKINENNKQLGH